MPGDTEGGDRFGFSLAAGDFGRGSRTDLAIGAPFEDVRTSSFVCCETNDAGGITILYGSAGGLTGTGSQGLHQNSDGVPDSGGDRDQFGRTLSASNLGGSPVADLAVGIPREDVDGDDDAGAVAVLYSSPTAGVLGAGSQLWTQDTGAIADGTESGDQFSNALN